MLWRNYYCHGECPLSNDPVCWTDEWSSRSNDHCPKCDADVEPFRSVELDDELPPRSNKMAKLPKAPADHRTFYGDLKIKYVHLRDTEFFTDKNGKKREGFATNGGTTIAYAVYDNPEAPGPMVRFGYASCHPTDSFNRKQGNVKAAGRLRSLRLGREVTMDEPELTEEKIITAVITMVHREIEQRRDAALGNAQ